MVLERVVTGDPAGVYMLVRNRYKGLWCDYKRRDRGNREVCGGQGFGFGRDYVLVRGEQKVGRGEQKWEGTVKGFGFALG